MELSVRHSVFALAEILGAQLIAMGVVARHGAFNDTKRGVSRADFLDLHLLSFELLVVLEKALEDEQAMRGEIARLDVLVEPWWRRR